MANKKHVCTINALFVSFGLANPMHSTQDNEANGEKKRKRFISIYGDNKILLK